MNRFIRKSACTDMADGGAVTRDEEERERRCQRFCLMRVVNSVTWL